MSKKDKESRFPYPPPGPAPDPSKLASFVLIPGKRQCVFLGNVFDDGQTIDYHGRTWQCEDGTWK